jgi:hypothetical protein
VQRTTQSSLTSPSRALFTPRTTLSKNLSSPVFRRTLNLTPPKASSTFKRPPFRRAFMLLPTETPSTQKVLLFRQRRLPGHPRLFGSDYLSTLGPSVNPKRAPLRVAFASPRTPRFQSGRYLRPIRLPGNRKLRFFQSFWLPHGSRQQESDFESLLWISKVSGLRRLTDDVCYEKTGPRLPCYLHRDHACFG